MRTPDARARFRRVKSIFLGARDLDEVGRITYLDEACGDDSDLRGEVESLLAALSSADDRFATAAIQLGMQETVVSALEEPMPGLLAGRYRIDTYLAEGGMGRVYKAHDLELDTPIALKTIHPRVAAQPYNLRLFKQEVLLARSITHPNVCRIFNLVQDENTGILFLTMEYLDGETLASRIQSAGRLESSLALDLVRDMADALDAAHRAGVVHRDLKCANVMLVPCSERRRDRAVITDFGLAVSVDDEEAEGTGLPLIAGTPAYMAPEQAEGGRVGPATDLYSLGVVLFEMCTGELPFPHSTPLKTARAHATKTPPNPSDLAPLPDRWEQAILRLLAKKPRDRFATAHDAVMALEGRTDERREVVHSLVAERDVFVGRGQELEDLAATLEGDLQGRSAARLLTVVGPGGTGKTRLAQKYGWDSLLRWPGGVWFCDLNESRDVDGIARVVATAMSVELGRSEPIVQLGHAIRARGTTLIVLDNFEHLITHATATVSQWLKSTTKARYLVTSREVLHLPEERTLELEPLDPATRGVELFESRAWANRPGFAVDPTNRALVAEIVQKLDGLPLAIEFAAARLRSLTLDQLHSGLEDRFRLLIGKKKGRYATLEATLDWSWDLLNSFERSVIAQASIFEGGFMLEAAEAVIDADTSSETRTVLDVIQSLVDKSWLRARANLGAPRFAMYATVQAYAAAKLQEITSSPEVGSSETPASLETVERRHGAYFATMGTEDALEKLDWRSGTQLRAAMHRELDNLVAACRRSIPRRDEEVMVSCYAAAGEVYESLGPIGTSIQLGREVLPFINDAGRRGRVLGIKASAERLGGVGHQAQEDFEAALEICRDIGDRRTEGVLLGNLADLLLDLGKVDEARNHYDSALAICRELGNRRSEGLVLAALGVLHKQQGRMSEAREHYEAALAIYHELGYRRHAGRVRCNLAVLHMEQGRMEEAHEDYDLALTISREEGNRRSEGIVRANQALICDAQGRTDEAREHHEAALAIHRELGDRRTEGQLLTNLGAFHRTQGRIDEGLAHYEEALTIIREVGEKRFEGILLGNLGICHFVQGRMKEALAHYEAALPIRHELGDKLGEAIVLGNLGDVHMEEGRLEEARDHYEAAVRIHREIGHRRFEGTILGSLAAVCRLQGQLKEARDRFAEGEALLRKVDDRVQLGTLLCGRGELEHAIGAEDDARATLQEVEALAAQLEVDVESEFGRGLDNLRQTLGGDVVS